MKKSKKSEKLLGAREGAPVKIENEKGRASCLIVCDHASNRIPKKLGTLGVAKKDLVKHIAWDPGTAEIGRYLAKKIDATLVLSTYSRIVVDVNRGEKSPECMRETYDHIRIPGNCNLSRADKKQRIDEIFNPYHATLKKQVEKYLKKKKVPVLLSIHSFTPEMDGYKRPWHIGILWNKEEGIANELIANLRHNNPKITVGENEPYSLKSANLAKNTVTTHAESRGLPYIIVEFRQDLVNTKAKAEKWAKIFLDSLAPILADPDVYRLRRFRRR